MHDDANEPAAGPVPAHEETRPAVWGRAAVLLGIGCSVGLTLGVLLPAGLSTTYHPLFTPTVPINRDWVQVFNELNDLRQQINQLNADRKLADQANVDAIRQALDAVTATARPPSQGMPGAITPATKPDGAAAKPPVAKASGPFAEIDEEIRRLEETQQVLNTILDMFTPKDKERAKDRPSPAKPPE